MSEEDGSLEELTLQFSGLQITIRRSGTSVSGSAPSGRERPSAVSSSPSASQASTGPLAGERASDSQGRRLGNLSLAEDTLLHASTLDELLAFDLGAHLHLCRGLSAGAPWTPQARIARAFRAGIAARLVLAGVTDYQQASLAVPFRNRCYIVLRCRAYPRGFYTEELATFRRHVPKDSAGRLEQGSVCHAFASRAEATAFAAGAQAPWPAEL